MYRSRLSKKIKGAAARFTTSLGTDSRYFNEDIAASIAHVQMLAAQKIIDKSEESELIKALKETRDLYRSGELKLDEELEDIHPIIEKQVMHTAGITGGKLQTARSRNDQIMTDVRMAFRQQILDLQDHLLSLLETLTKNAWKDADKVMPAYTHIQHAQVITFGHYLMSQADLLLRDYSRLDEAYKITNQNPLGAGACGGTSFETDRHMTTESLGFDSLIENSLDAVSSRDFILQTVSALSILMSNISRVAEDLILFSTHEFGMVEIDEKYCSSSSAMPQKKNPDVLELIRGRTARVFGNMTQAFVVMKGTPTGYNRDFQEAHTLVFESFDTVADSLSLLREIISTLKLNTDRMSELASQNFACAYDLTELLVRKGIAFRNAHAVVGAIVEDFSKTGKKLGEVDTEFIQNIILRKLKFEVKLSDSELKKAVVPSEAIRERKSKGSPNPKEVKRMSANRELLIDKKRKDLRKKKRKLETALSKF